MITGLDPLEVYPVTQAPNMLDRPTEVVAVAAGFGPFPCTLPVARCVAK